MGNLRSLSGNVPVSSSSSSFNVVTTTPPPVGGDYTIHLTFEGGEVGALARTGSTGFSGGGNESTYSNVRAYTGTQSCRTRELQGVEKTGNFGGDIAGSRLPTLGKGDIFWYRAAFYMPSNFDYSASPNDLKTFRVPTKSSTGVWKGYHDFLIRPPGSSQAVKVSYEGNQGGNGERYMLVGDASDKPTKDDWFVYEYSVTLDNVPKDDGGLGVIRCWKDGVLFSEVTNLRTLTSSTDTTGGNAIRFHTYWNGGGPNTSNYEWVDDIIIQASTDGIPKGRDSAGNPMIGV